MYRVFKSLWYSKKWVNFVELKDGVFLVKFSLMEDRERVLNLTPWLFDQNLFAMVPYEKNMEFRHYEFNLVPFWIRIFNIPLELKDRQIATKVGGAIGKLMAIDWRDRAGCWEEFIRIRVLVDIIKPLRRIAKVVKKTGMEITCVLKYERLPVFCYICGRVGYSTKKCDLFSEEISPEEFQYGNWLRVKLIPQGSSNGKWRNGVEIIEDSKSWKR